MSDYICLYNCSYRTNSGYCGYTGGYEACQYRRIKRRMDAADVQPVRHGRWVKTADFSDEPIDWVVCDRCKAKIPDFDYSYCPNCGAIMDKSE